MGMLLCFACLRMSDTQRCLPSPSLKSPTECLNAIRQFSGTVMLVVHKTPLRVPNMFYRKKSVCSVSIMIENPLKRRFLTPSPTGTVSTAYPDAENWVYLVTAGSSGLQQLIYLCCLSLLESKSLIASIIAEVITTIRGRSFYYVEVHLRL